MASHAVAWTENLSLADYITDAEAAFRPLHGSLKTLAEILRRVGYYQARLVAPERQGNDLSSYFLFVKDHRKGESHDLGIFVAREPICVTLSAIHNIKLANTFYSLETALHAVDDWCAASFPDIYYDYLCDVFKVDALDTEADDGYLPY